MKNKKNIKGFTLIELLVVVAIIGVLAAVGVTAFQGFTDNAKKQAMKSIHNGLVKSISAELKKCSIGNTTFMNGTSRTGATYSRPCSSNNNTMAAYARDGAFNTSKDKNPLYYIVNRFQKKVTFSEGHFFDKYTFLYQENKK